MKIMTLTTFEIVLTENILLFFSSTGVRGWYAEFAMRPLSSATFPLGGMAQLIIKCFWPLGLNYKII